MMYVFGAGFVLSLLGSLPPGLISLTVANTSIQRGLVAALILATGAALAEFFQACAAVVLSDWFMAHPGVDAVFKWIAVVVFLSLSVFLLLSAPAPKPPEDKVRASFFGQFGKGIAISSVNLLAIPYWFVYCGWLRVEGWWQEGVAGTILFAAGVTLGTIAALGLYAWLGLLILERSQFLARKANQLVGWIFLGLGAKMLWGLI